MICKVKYWKKYFVFSLFYYIVHIIKYIYQLMNITIIDDEVILANNISRKLEKNNFQVKVFHNCKDFYNADYSSQDLYIIDIGLWDWTGFEIIQRLRKKKESKAYIIITSSFWDLEKKIYWLDIGADDYMTKPCNPDELVARIKANLRRKNVDEVYEDNIYTYKNIEYNVDKNLLLQWDVVINLTKKERLLVKMFLSAQNCLITKWDVIEKVWQIDDELSVSDNTINVTISNLRKKLWSEFKLKTKVNEGYILEI